MEKLEREGVRYIREEDGLLVESCEDTDDEIVLPDRIGGLAVAGAGPYAFSGRHIRSIRLPRFLERLGGYVFYRCFELRSLSFSDRLRDIGAGAFTGCRLEKIEIDCYEGEKTCLKFIADEIRYRLDVTLRYHREDGSVDTAKVVFPEHYEEAVENTPARIVTTHYHGSGGDYRQCFYDRELNYVEYDSLLPRAVAEEDEETVVDIASFRLRFPYRLSGQARLRYEACLKEHIACAGKRYAKQENVDMLRFFGKCGYWTKEGIDQAIGIASGEGRTEVLSMLMDERRRSFAGGKKVFEW